MVKRTLLLIEPDPGQRETLARALGAADFVVASCGAGVEGIKRAAQDLPAIIVTELLLPDIEGADMCRELKGNQATSRIPFVVVSSKTEEIDRVLSFELGAEDYLAKPFSVRELILRLKRAMARVSDHASSPELVRVGDLSVDQARGEVFVKGKPVRMTPQEIKLLALLMERKGKLQTRHRLLREVWQYDIFNNSRTVDTHIRRIRIKLGDMGDCLENVRRMGYRIRDVEAVDQKTDLQRAA